MSVRPGAGLPATYGRSTRRYKRLKAEFRAGCERVSAPCWLCGMVIDYAAKVGEPDAFNLDHMLPVHTHPELAEDPANFRPSHENCNKSKGTKDARGIGLGQRSRDW